MKDLSGFLLALFMVVAPVSGTTHTIVSSGFTFSPDNLTIILGDPVVSME